MTSYQYHSQLQPGTQTSFRETSAAKGHYALTGAVGKKSADLLEQFIPLLEAPGPPANEQFYRYLEAFLTWFRQGYEQKKGEPCPFPDDEIIEGVGLFWANASGQAVFISTGNFQFSYLHDKLLHPVQQGFQSLALPSGTVLIADPNRSEESLSVSRIYRDGGGQWTALAGQTFVHPVGLVWAEVVTVQASETKRSPKELKRFVLPLLIAILIGLGAGLFWANHQGWISFPKIGHSGTDSTALATDTTQSVDRDTTQLAGDPSTALPDTVPQADELPNKVANTDNRRTETTPSLSDRTSSNMSKQQQPSADPDELAQSYLYTAVNTFDEAEVLRADGKAKQARALYGTALENFRKYLQRVPESKDAVQQPMARCQQFIQLYDSQ